MRTAWRVSLIFLTLAVVLAAGAFALGLQTSPRQQPPLFTPTPNTSPKVTVITGDDIGFRVDGYKAGVPVGSVVVKVDGKWVEPLPPPPSPRFAK